MPKGREKKREARLKWWSQICTHTFPNKLHTPLTLGDEAICGVSSTTAKSNQITRGPVKMTMWMVKLDAVMLVPGFCFFSGVRHWPEKKERTDWQHSSYLFLLHVSSVCVSVMLGSAVSLHRVSVMGHILTILSYTPQWLHQLSSTSSSSVCVAFFHVCRSKTLFLSFPPPDCLYFSPSVLFILLPQLLLSFSVKCNLLLPLIVCLKSIHPTLVQAD